MLYVDNARIPYRRMLMSHLIADSQKELLRATIQLGLKPAYIQHGGTWKEHLDVCVSKRAYAIKHLGAKPVTSREIVAIGRRKETMAKKKYKKVAKKPKMRAKQERLFEEVEVRIQIGGTDEKDKKFRGKRKIKGWKHKKLSGVAITPVYTGTRKKPTYSKEEYVLTHMRSGLSMGNPSDLLTARNKIIKLLELGENWDLPKKDATALAHKLRNAEPRVFEFLVDNGTLVEVGG